MSKKEHGVSPVVGIIIILAVTVMLAAIVAYRAENMSSRMKNVPSACFALSDCPEPLSSGKVFKITEVGGDTLLPQNLRILIKNGSKAYSLEWNGSAFAGDNLYIPVKGEIMPGKDMTCYQSTEVFSGKTKLIVEIIYKPAGAIIFKGPVWVE